MTWEEWLDFREKVRDRFWSVLRTWPDCNNQNLNHALEDVLFLVQDVVVPPPK